MIFSSITGIWANIWSSLIKLPRRAQLALGVAAVCLAAFLLHRCVVNDAVQADRKAQEAQVLEKALSAERSANSADAIRQAEIQAKDDVMREAIDNAVSAHPEAVRTPAGSATNAVARELRARSSSNSPPAR